MNKKEVLIHAQKSGTIVKVAYKTGSQPNHAREIIPLRIEDDQVLVKCLTSNTQKRFYIDKIELLSDRKYNDLAKWDPDFIAVTDYEKFKIHREKRKKIHRYLCAIFVMFALAVIYLHLH